MSEDTNPQVPNDETDTDEMSDDILDQASGGRSPSWARRELGSTSGE